MEKILNLIDFRCYEIAQTAPSTSHSLLNIDNYKQSVSFSHFLSFLYTFHIPNNNTLQFHVDTFSNIFWANTEKEVFNYGC